MDYFNYYLHLIIILWSRLDIPTGDWECASNKFKQKHQILFIVQQCKLLQNRIWIQNKYKWNREYTPTKKLYNYYYIFTIQFNAMGVKLIMNKRCLWINLANAFYMMFPWILTILWGLVVAWRLTLQQTCFWSNEFLISSISSRPYSWDCFKLCTKLDGAPKIIHWPERPFFVVGKKEFGRNTSIFF